MTSRIYAEYSSLINLAYFVSWSFYNFENFKPNGLARPFGKKNRKTFSTFELLSELSILLIK